MSEDNYYLVCGKKYVNKLEAYREALPRGFWPHWNFFEKQFSQKNWSVEPEESLVELYHQRARKIRDQYDYIICWFSGGSDSDNMVLSFLEQGLHVDEIWHRSTLARHARRDNGQDALNAANETRLATIPRLKEYQSRFPWWNPKVKIFDLTELSIKLWGERARDPYSTNYYNLLLPGKENSDYFNVGYLRGKKICKLLGIDKPIVRYHKNKFYVSFLDVILHTNAMQQPRNNVMEQDVFFYWHPDAADIIIKQSHLIMKWFCANPHLLHILDIDSGEYCQHRANKLIKNIIYPSWKSDRWQQDKPSSDLTHEEFYWFYKNKDNVSVKNWYNTALEYAREIKKIYSDVLPKEQNFRTIENFSILPGNYSKWYLIN